MRSYSNRYRWTKVSFVVAALLIIICTVVLVRRFEQSMLWNEESRIALWSEAMKRLAEADDNEDVSFLLKIINSNDDIPVLLVDESDRLVGGESGARNVDLPVDPSVWESYVRECVSRFSEIHAPIRIEVGDECQYVYYDESKTLRSVRYFSFGILAVVSVFCLMLLFFFLSVRRSEQDDVWVGLSKETAHQLGTPISSLNGWVELMRMKHSEDEDMFQEMDKDIHRLQVITERFSKIGSRPELKASDICEVVESALAYMRQRASKGTEIGFVCQCSAGLRVPLNAPLFEWVIENLCKNAMDVMGGGKGRIDVLLTEEGEHVVLDVTDTGSGIPRSKWDDVFKAGYTTKSRGWGLGLSLAKRIVNEYHGGRIFVKWSEEGRGTTFSIVLAKQENGKKKKG